MNDLKMSLHWLRKDLRHHRVWLLVWVGLVMVFTAIRLYFRLGPVEIGYRNYLSVSLEITGLLSAFAEALALGEMGLILRILRDDPARGSHAFWKTRPPSGNVMFSAKAMAVLLVAMIPLIGEWIFLKVAGFSGGTRERIFCYLLPLVVGLAGGVAFAGVPGEVYRCRLGEL